MYHAVCVILIGICIYSFADMRPCVAAPAAGSYVLALGLAIGAALVCRLLFMRAPATRQAHDRRRTAAEGVCLGAFALIVHATDIRCAMPSIALVGGFTTTSSLLAIVALLGLLSCAWYAAGASYRRLTGVLLSQQEYVLTQIRLHGVFCLPWLAYGLLIDLAGAMSAQIPDFLINAPLAQLCLALLILSLMAMLIPWCVVRLWGCRSLPPGALRTQLEQRSRVAGCTFRDYVLLDLFPGSMVTAGVIGIVRGMRYFMISPALLDVLSPAQLDAVCAHEIGHVKHGHMWFYLLFIFGYGCLAFVLSQLLTIALGLLAPGAAGIVTADGRPGWVLSWLPIVVLLIGFVLYFRFLFGFFSRTFERQADTDAMRDTDDPQPIITALATVNSLTGRSPDASCWHHHSIQQRIAFLLHCQREPARIRHHDRRARWRVGTFVLALLVVVSLDLLFVDRPSRTAELGLNALALERRIITTGGGTIAELASLAAIVHQLGRIEEAAGWYGAALQQQPGHPELLNNLAWLYATADRPGLRRPAEAVALASRAAAQHPAAYILDTLAESHYAAGQFEKAVAVGRRALTVATDRRGYYKKQLQKFMDARHNTKRD